MRSWSARGSACDQAASAVYDPDRLAPGASMENIDVDIANSACSQETAKRAHAAQADYQLGRTLFAKGDANGARRQFEIAVAGGYRAARVDLADLLVNVPAKTLDPGCAVSLYEDGVARPRPDHGFQAWSSLRIWVAGFGCLRNRNDSHRRVQGMAVVPKGCRCRRTERAGAVCRSRREKCSRGGGCVEEKCVIAERLHALRGCCLGVPTARIGRTMLGNTGDIVAPHSRVCLQERE